MKKEFFSAYKLAAVMLTVLTLFLSGCSAEQASLPLKPAAAKTALLHTTWRISEINGSKVVFRPGQKLDVSLVFSKGGQFSGTTGCNYLNGTYILKKDQLNFGSLAITRIACSPQLMAQEREYLGAIRKASSYAINANSLKLFSADGRKIMDLIAVMRP
ncbi:MAG: META domain-containing protein [Chlorobiaceae bacterium]|jgi:heat shock protein HslJ|nr:META domain-containing protein [Chlorobiaceae bacterium]